jgi:GAF domain-containing protein
MSQLTARTDYSKRLTDLQRCLVTLHKQHSPRELAETVVSFLRESFAFDFIWIGQYSSAQNLLSGLGGYLGKGDSSVLSRSWSILPGDLFDQVLLTGAAAETPDLRAENRIGDWQAIAQKYGIQGAMILPIRHHHKSQGILIVGSTLWGTYPPRSEESTALELVISALGAAFYSPQVSAHNTSVQDGAVLWRAIDQLMSSPSFEGRIEKALGIAFETLKSAKVSLYRIDPVQRSCYLHTFYSERQGKRGLVKPHTRTELSLQDIATFHQYLSYNPVLGVADVNSVADSHNAPARLMGLTKVQAMLCVAIHRNQQLYGFLAVEEEGPRLWTEDEKQLLKTLGQLLGSSAMASDEVPGQSKFERCLKGLQNPVCDKQQWFALLQQGLEALCLEYGAQWSAIFDYDLEEHQFICVAKGQTIRRKSSFPDLLPALSEVDFGLLERSVLPIQINLAAQDLKFLNWHPPLLEVGVQNLLILKMKGKRGVDPILLLGMDQASRWLEQDCQTLNDTAKQLGQFLEDHRRWQQTQVQHQLLQDFIQGFSAVQQLPLGAERCAAAGITLQQFLGVDSLILLQWTPAQAFATITYRSLASDLEVLPQSAIVWKTDQLLRQVLQNPISAEHSTNCHSFSWSASLLIAQADPWIESSNAVEGFAIPMRCPIGEETFGVILAITSQPRRWQKFEYEGASLVATTLAEGCRADYIQSVLTHNHEQLECLNWYKQRQIEQLAQCWQAQTAHLQAWLPPKEANPSGSLRNRKPQPIEVLSQSFQSIETILKGEVWQLSMASELLPLATLLRRSLERIEPIVKERQLWTQVHNAPPNTMVQVPGLKLELILTELLLTSCYRTKISSRVDIWCRLPSPEWVEITITDMGRLNPQLAHDIREQSYRSPLYPSAANTLPGLHFKICQILIHQLGGEFDVGQLEDGRVYSRVLLRVKS